MKNEVKSEITYLFLVGVAVFLSSVWNNVGMTMTCNRCDVMSHRSPQVVIYVLCHDIIINFQPRLQESCVGIP